MKSHKPKLLPKARKFEAQNVEIRERIPGEYIFTYQFYVHALHFAREFRNVARPAMAVRFLDFPSQVIPGTVRPLDGSLAFETGKKSSFRAHSDELRKSLTTKPLFCMFVDADPQHVHIVASSSVDVGIYAENDAFFDHEKPQINLR